MDVRCHKSSNTVHPLSYVQSYGNTMQHIAVRVAEIVYYDLELIFSQLRISLARSDVPILRSSIYIILIESLNMNIDTHTKGMQYVFCSKNNYQCEVIVLSCIYRCYRYG